MGCRTRLDKAPMEACLDVVVLALPLVVAGTGGGGEERAQIKEWGGEGQVACAVSCVWVKPGRMYFAYFCVYTCLA